MRPKRMRRILVAAFALLFTAAVQARQSPPPAVTFDTAWTIIRNTYFDSTFHGVNWNDVRAELRPKAEASKNNDELRAVLAERAGAHEALATRAVELAGAARAGLASRERE